MNFYVYHKFNLGLINFLCHNLSNRNIDDILKKVTGNYNGVDVVFYFGFANFGKFDDKTLSDGYHIICREEAVQEKFFLEDMNTYQKKFGFPECLKHEYSLLNSNIEFNTYNWILFWNFGENKFVHMGTHDLSDNDELESLKKIVNSTIFLSDNYIHDDTPYGKVNPYAKVNSRKLIKTLTNDVFMWNYYAQIVWANEFKNVFKHLNPPHKLCVSFRSPKPHRIEICEKLGNKNLKDVYVSYSSKFFESSEGKIDHTWDGIEYNKIYDTLKTIKNLNINKIGESSETDFQNLRLAGNTSSYMEFDYYFRILYQGKLQLLDETHSNYVSKNNPMVPINLSEKTYILLLANIPFISTHHYPIDLIQEHILNVEYPYYYEIKEASNDIDKLVSFIEKIIINFDEMYPKIQEWTNLVHEELQKKIRNENSFLEHMTTKI
tara:strand:+ start:465 stop:1769 length:1305 start_codon:yes stop_codon:yes gene_type:complete